MNLMNLPNNEGLPVNNLAACFNRTSATYKYYWFLSILQSLEEGNDKILKKNLFSRMISNAWFTVNYFHVSFGKQDQLQRAIKAIKEFELITIDENNVFRKLINSTNPNTLTQLQYFDNQVPHWFLSPWFPKLQNETETQQARRIYADSSKSSNKSLYGLFDDRIEINTEWKDYLLSNAGILKDFCYWNLAIYLQVKNPNVPDIPNKLIKPALRNSLTKQRSKFWDLVINELGFVECIYTGEKLTVGHYAVDHFIPFNFVSHDLIWNLIPAFPAYNSTKSDKLPIMKKHFDKFFILQKKAIEIVLSKTPSSKLLEEYYTIFPDLESSITKEKYSECLQPLITIASNNGFEFL